jgi:hypothetical protein
MKNLEARRCRERSQQVAVFDSQLALYRIVLIAAMPPIEPSEWAPDRRLPVCHQ